MLVIAGTTPSPTRLGPMRRRSDRGTAAVSDAVKFKRRN